MGRRRCSTRFEFNPLISCIDVFYDMGFLLMDLWHRELRVHANAAWNAYLGETADVDLVVHFANGLDWTDTEIAKAAVAAFEWNTLVPKTVTISVTNGWLTINGQVNWQFQKDAAARAVRHLPGLKGIVNHIAVEPQAKAGDVREKIEAAPGVTQVDDRLTIAPSRRPVTPAAVARACRLRAARASARRIESRMLPARPIRCPR
jgi:hypothetical protein